MLLLLPCQSYCCSHCWLWVLWCCNKILLCCFWSTQRTVFLIHYSYAKWISLMTIVKLILSWTISHLYWDLFLVSYLIWSLPDLNLINLYLVTLLLGLFKKFQSLFNYFTHFCQSDCNATECQNWKNTPFGRAASVEVSFSVWPLDLAWWSNF